MPRHHESGDCCVTVALPFELIAARTARQLVTRDLEAAGVRQSVIDDAALVVSELVANGIVHGRPDDVGELEVSWCLSDGFLRLSVIDGGNAGTLQPMELTDDAVSGRGLAIVDYLCSEWTVDHSSGTRVTAELSIG